MKPTIIQGIAGIYWFFDPRRVTEYRIALIFGITEDEVRSIKESSAYLDAIENLMRTTRSSFEFVDWMEMETLSEISERLGKRMGIDPSLIPDMIDRVRHSHSDQDLNRGTTKVMNEITIAQEKARDAIDLLKEAVFAIVRHETEAGSGVRRAEVRNWLEIGREDYPTPKKGWDMGQAIFIILLLLQEDGLIERSSLDSRKWVLSKKGKADPYIGRT